MRRALITGVTGQDGSYLAELLLKKGYKVYGFIRRCSVDTTKRIKKAIEHENFSLIQGDMTDGQSIDNAVSIVRPHEVYNLAAQSFVPVSWDEPAYTFNVNTIGLTRLLEAVRLHSPEACVYQASTSEMYGNSYPEFKPRSPYGISKLAAHYIARQYRENYNLFVCCGISFNHESPRRGDEFVTKKITNFVKHPVGKLKMGTLHSSRDWGFAGDYVEAMHMMLQCTTPKDYEICTGKAHTVGDFLDEAFAVKGISWKKYVEIDAAFIRPNEIKTLKGDNSSIKEIGWSPRTSFRELVKMMVEE